MSVAVTPRKAGCEHKLPAIRDMMIRQSSSGNILLLLFAMWILIPAAIERYRGEPNIQATLSLVQDGWRYTLNDKVTVKYPNSGSRFNVLLDDENRIICSKSWMNYWSKSTDLTWSLPAFVDCEAPLDTPFRICSYFSLTSKSGNNKKIGSDYAFCTSMAYPNFKF